MDATAPIQAWRERLKAYLAETIVDHHCWMIYRPDRQADEAMMTLSVDYAGPISALRDTVRDADTLLDRFQEINDETTRHELADCLDVLVDRIGQATSIIDPAKRHVFGLLVDHKKRTVRREGFDKELELSSMRWHIFSVALAAAPKQATLEALHDGYPGQWNGLARANANVELNRLLKRLNVKVKNRRLIELP